MNARGICFRAGPYRGWSLNIDEYDNGAFRVHVEGIPPAGSTVGPAGVVGLRPGMDGYDLARATLTGHGRESMEHVLTWLLDTTGAALRDPGRDIHADQRTHWAGIVADGIAARQVYAEMWGGGPEPVFQTVPTAQELADAQARWAALRAAALAGLRPERAEQTT